MQRTRSKKAKKNIKLLCVGIPSNISFFQSFPVTLSIYFTKSSHIFRLHICRLRGEPEPGSHVSLESLEGGGELDWQLTICRQNKDRGFIQDTAGLYGHICFSLFSHPLSGRPFDSFCFGLFCFSYRPCCQLGPEATMSMKYWAKQHLININNMHRENLADEKPTDIFSGRQTECKWLWKI